MRYRVKDDAPAATAARRAAAAVERIGRSHSCVRIADCARSVCDDLKRPGGIFAGARFRHRAIVSAGGTLVLKSSTGHDEVAAGGATATSLQLLSASGHIVAVFIRGNADYG